MTSICKVSSGPRTDSPAGVSSPLFPSVAGELPAFKGSSGLLTWLGKTQLKDVPLKGVATSPETSGTVHFQAEGRPSQSRELGSSWRGRLGRRGGIWQGKGEAARLERFALLGWILPLVKRSIGCTVGGISNHSTFMGFDVKR